ncbi:tRNA pseudouridine synthase A [Spizellomyces punctatus DAOM BR117]|uniref:tRNA pseudouridine synthase n=1 Tax=Spizellomyces punctatus (strain DAOM BR117) TaxID=645134 RepID=A0A0L0HAH7_SPIPD|nr:tRNA pseudouridine synthase A [Spizellomyces punctatus DAOM BR117]KNC98152.1 tRNA pseudouridine synthase A [Spizellomyces punctatus DAOM BR117]|eukprot:XP_016606192.1 tRNA pseudouridine synthase A [Spizellomyces punctatus DAOM BR117]
MHFYPRILVRSHKERFLQIYPWSICRPPTGVSRLHSSCTVQPNTPFVAAEDVRRARKPYNFGRYNKRRVAFRVAYIGWDYHGFARQKLTTRTVEERIFDALLETKLIDSTRNCHWSRSARTDTGVSSVGSVVALDVRSRLPVSRGNVPWQTSRHDAINADVEPINDQSSHLVAGELPYVIMLNKVLPSDIRILAWAPVPPTFDARYDCLHRTYKYLFDPSGLDTTKMQRAASQFVGVHDFRNFCKFAKGKPLAAYRRAIDLVSVNRLTDIEDRAFESNILAGRLYCVTIRARAFLWHQIRCMMTILFLIGRGLEDESIVGKLLNVEPSVGKPMYGLADETSLILADCAYSDIAWYDASASSLGPAGSLDNMSQRKSADAWLLSQLRLEERKAALKGFMIRSMLETVGHSIDTSLIGRDDYLRDDRRFGGGISAYTKIMERKRLEPIESRMAIR